MVPTAGQAIVGVHWNFPLEQAGRKALGSDLWPCTWAADDDLYCAWGDGGGFDGNDDHIGRASLGFARVRGRPSVADPGAYVGSNIWGQRPYAEVQATFGGKVDSLIAVAGSLYATAWLWTAQDSADAVHQSERGPHEALICSRDLGRSWSVVSTARQLANGWFLDFGRDQAGAVDAYVYLYYQRAGDDRDIYLKRIPRDQLASGTVSAAQLRYVAAVSRHGDALSWSENEAQATPVFVDRRGAVTPSVVYDAPLNRYLLTVGHRLGSQATAESPAQVGLFAAPHPWGPWARVGYYQRWGNLQSVRTDDFLGLHIPSKWISKDGKQFWAVFSSVGAFDSFNVVEATLVTRHPWLWRGR
jgi:hypothetical protein